MTFFAWAVDIGLSSPSIILSNVSVTMAPSTVQCAPAGPGMTLQLILPAEYVALPTSPAGLVRGSLSATARASLP